MSPENSKFSLILFSGDLDKAMAALTLANGAAGRGFDVTIFFTFWGMSLLREKTITGENFLENMFKRLMPQGVDHIGLSRFNFCGIGPRLLNQLIRSKRGQSVKDLFKMAMDRKVRFIACEASLKLLGIRPEELIKYQYLEIAGVEQFIEIAHQAKVSMFV